MKNVKIGLVGFILFLAVNASAQDYKTAVGIRLSNADAAVSNSITVKHFFKPTIAVEALVSFGDPMALGVLIEKHKPIASAAGLQWFYGAGAYVGFGEGQILGGQGVVGLDYKFSAIPLNLSLDWKPELNLISDFSFEPAAVGLSARFTF